MPIKGIFLFFQFLKGCSCREANGDDLTAIVTSLILYGFWFVQDDHSYMGGRGGKVCSGPQRCEMSRVPHSQDNWFTDSGEVSFTPRNIPGTYFLLVAESTPGS
jgi:hypothetical protein